MPVGHLVLRGVVLPFYRLGLTVKLRIQRFILPTRGVALFFVSSRYLFHFVLAVAALATIGANLWTRQARAEDVGQNSLLYALVTNSDVEIVNETANNAPLTKTTSYLGSNALVAIPHIDFDYDQGSNGLATPATPVPGAIVAPLDLGETTEPTKEPVTPRTKTETYIVKEGDTIASIARSFGVNVGTILWSNSMTERQYIRPGDSLKIPPVSGILVTVKKGDTLSKLADRYNGDAAEIKDFNHLNDGALAVGSEIMIPGGTPSAPEQTIIAVIGQNQEKRNPKENPTKKPTIKEVPIGDKIAVIKDTPVLKDIEIPSIEVEKPKDIDTSDVPTTRLVWPTSGHSITQYYGWRHTGVDIDGDFTSPLIAAYDGVVETAGWNNGGYGLQVVIRHPNGMKTRYAHSSKLFVKEGDEVKRGQTIAMMGSTGYSTGSHLHFEVYVNGVRTNPLAYIR